MRIRFAAALAAAAVLGMSLTGCGKLGQNYTDYIKGVMDLRYKDDPAKYVELTYSNELEAREIYDIQLEYMTETVCTYNGVEMDYVSDDLLAEYEAIAETLLSKTSYNVLPATYSNGTFQVTIEIQPLDFWEITEEEMQDYCDTMYNVEKKLVRTDAELEALETKYAEGTLEILQSHVSEVGYLDTVTKTVTIVEDADGTYGLSDQDWYDIDDLVLGLG